MAEFRDLKEHYTMDPKPIGEGAFGEVYKGIEIVSGRLVALKKLKYSKSKLDEKPVLPLSSKREVENLKKLNHENVIRLMEVVTSPDVKEEAIYMYIVFEYMDYDFAVLTERKKTFSALEIKYYMMQLLTGLAYCHGQSILYRDIKRANILVGKDRKLKLADFGLSRFVEEVIDTENLLSDYPETFDYLCGTYEEFSNSIMALSYRAPELLLGETKYGSEVDIWAVGCLFAELVNGGAKIFPLSSEDDLKLRLEKIFQVCGSPDEHNWPQVYDLSKFDASILPNPPMKRRVREVFGNFDPHALDLLDRMLVLDPTKRISATDALAATYFSTEPLPDDAKRLPPYDF